MQTFPGTKQTPQAEPILGSTQVPNSAGGYTFQVDDWARLDRFLILGTEGGSYYATEKVLSKECAEAVLRCAQYDANRTIDRIVEVSDKGLALKNDPALFALAMISSLGDDKARRRAFQVLPSVARTGTHLFHFAQYRKLFGGWGKGMKLAVSNWYSSKDVDDLAYQVVKYQSRDGWSHRDLLRLSHPVPYTSARAALYKWITKWDGKPIEGRPRMEAGQLPELIVAFETLKGFENDPEAASRIIKASGMPREAIPSKLLTSPLIWDVMLPTLGMTALIRNLGTMSKVGLLVAGSEAEKEVVNRLTSAEALRNARVHPIQILTALMTYKAGHGARSKATWPVSTKVVDALDDAFYKSFEYVEPTGKRYCLALDVSGSMGWPDNFMRVPGMSPRVMSAAFAMVTARTEQNYEIMAFCHKFVPLTVSPRQRLDDVVEQISNLEFGSTDCSLPMVWAKENKRNFDMFTVYTDSETFIGEIHPTQALADYRRHQVQNAKLAVVAMVANAFSIADPKDLGQMDFVGCSSDLPAALAAFAKS